MTDKEKNGSSVSRLESQTGAENGVHSRLTTGSNQGEMLKPIVIVEDNPNDLELTLVALEKARLANELIILRDGAEAVDYLCCLGKWEAREPGNPAVILLDLKLPKRTGLEVLETIKGNPELRKVPVVMLTGSREEVDLERSYGLGVNAYVVKPVNFQDFVAAVQDLGGFWAVLNEPPPGSIRPGVGVSGKQ